MTEKIRAALCGIVALACLVIGSSRALAAQATVTWTLPTEYADGSALPAADLDHTTVDFGTCNGTAFGTLAGSSTAPAPATSVVIDNLTPGTWCFRASVTTIAARGSQTSGFSNVASKVVPFPAPKPPTLLDAVIAWLKRFFGWFA